MKHMYFKTMAAVLLALISFNACEEPDGDWERMKWKTEVKMSANHTINVPTSGGTYIFTCTNYAGPWISDVYENTNGAERHIIPESEEELQLLTASFSVIEIKGNKLTVTIKPNTFTMRSMALEVTAGDVYDTFVFVQQSGLGLPDNKEPEEQVALSEEFNGLWVHQIDKKTAIGYIFQEGYHVEEDDIVMGWVTGPIAMSVEKDAFEPHASFGKWYLNADDFSAAFLYYADGKNILTENDEPVLKILSPNELQDAEGHVFVRYSE